MKAKFVDNKTQEPRAKIQVSFFVGWYHVAYAYAYFVGSGKKPTKKAIEGRIRLNLWYGGVQEFQRTDDLSQEAETLLNEICEKSGQHFQNVKELYPELFS